MFWSFRKADRKYRVATLPGKNKYLETTLDGFNKPTLEKQDLEDEPPLPKNKIIPTLKFAIFYIWIFQKTTVIQRDRKALLLGMRLSVPIIGVFLLYKFSILISGSTCSSPSLFDVNQMTLVGLGLGSTLLINWLLLFVAKELHSSWYWGFYVFALSSIGGSMYVYINWGEDYSMDLIHFIIITWVIVTILDVVFVSIGSFSFFLILITVLKYPSPGTRSLLPNVHFKTQPKTKSNIFLTKTESVVKSP